MSAGVPGSWRSLDVRPRYTGKHIEVLLPLALWGIQPEQPATVPGMPKGGTDRPSDMPAMLADMQQAWARAHLLLAERRAVFSRLAVGLPWAVIAGRERVAKEETVADRYERGVNALLYYLNGDYA